MRWWRQTVKLLVAMSGVRSASVSKIWRSNVRASSVRAICSRSGEASLAQRLIVHARTLYARQPTVPDLDACVYALDSTTIDLCLSVFDWAPFRSTKAAIKLHSLLDLRGAIPAFIHISDGKLHDVNVLDILVVEAGSFYIMDRGYLDFERLYAMHPPVHKEWPGCPP